MITRLDNSYILVLITLYLNHISMCRVINTMYTGKTIWYALLVIIPILVSSIIITSEEVTPLVDGEVVIGTIYDPSGDDNGTGYLLYPTNEVFQPGIFDLLVFNVSEDNNYLYFRITLENLGGNPWNSPNGFSLQYIQIYILTTDYSLPRKYDTYGINVRVLGGWNYAILVTPGFDSEPVPTGQLSAIYFGDGSLIIDERSGDRFDIYVDQLINNTITIKIDKTLLLDLENIMDWVFTVVVAGYDGYQPSKVRQAVAGDPTEWEFGGADPDALNAGVFPLVVDLLASTPEEQYIMLQSYDSATGQYAVVSGVSLRPETTTTTKTVTNTITNTVTTTEIITTTQNITYTTTATETITETTTSTFTETLTQTITSTTTSTVTETETTTVTETIPLSTTTVTETTTTTETVPLSTTTVTETTTETTTETVTETITTTETTTKTITETETETSTVTETTTETETVIQTHSETTTETTTETILETITETTTETITTSETLTETSTTTVVIPTTFTETQLINNTITTTYTETVEKTIPYTSTEISTTTTTVSTGVDLGIAMILLIVAGLTGFVIGKFLLV